jgi:glycosyltransferase involved in cell wall biosynthesis
MRASALQVNVTPRILFFADASSVHTQRWVAAALARGAQAVVVSREPGEIKGAQVVTVAAGQDKLGWFTALPLLRRVVKTIAKDFKPNVLHGHYVTSYGFWAAACGLNLPRVLTAWGSDILVTPQESAFMRALVRWSLRRAHAITADSQSMLDAIRALHPQAPVEQILWGADTDHFCPGVPANDFELISLRSWEPNYNIDAIIEAFARFLTLRPHSHALLHLLGGGSMSAALQERVTSLRLLQQVRFHGRLDDAGMLALMQRCRASVSVPTSDATSVSVLESMACGLPIIATDLPANRQWVDERGGWIVAVRDIDALTHAFTDVHDNAEQATAKGQHNRQLVLAKASRQQQMDVAWQVYERLLKGVA